MAIFEKRLLVWTFGVTLPLSLLSVAAFGDSISGQQSVFQDAKLRTMFFLVGAAMFSIVILWLMKENAKLESYRTAAITDPLTGILNRQGKEKAFSRLLSTDFRKSHVQNGSKRIEVAVIYIDVDHFKKLNDTAGHAAGDRAIIMIADLVHGAFKRATDIVVREGGDEFVVILPYADSAAAKERAESLLAAARSSDELHRIEAQYGVRLTLSIGIASGIIETGKSWTHAQYTLDIASEAADESMYEVKRQGGDGISTWNPVVFGG